MKPSWRPLFVKASTSPMVVKMGLVALVKGRY
jgi:hypothetical protein